MRLCCDWPEAGCEVDLRHAIDLSRPVRPTAESVAFGLPPASERPISAGGFVGAVAKGGSVNCSTLSLCAHGNGTHTECVGHVLRDRVALADLLPPALLPCQLLSVTPMPLGRSGERYEGDGLPTDLVVTSTDLAASLARSTARAARPAAVVVRTGLGEARFTGENPPYFTLEAIDWLVSLGAEHVLTDLPSLDRESDGGGLCAHRRLWELQPGQVSLGDQAPSSRTVTELLRVPQSIPDGPYLLALQVPALYSDAAPSRPLLFPLRPNGPSAPEPHTGHEFC